MNSQLLPVGPYQVNCALLWGKEKKALILDPGYDAAEVENLLKSNGLDVAAYLLTHGHADHISALAGLHAAHPAPIVLHANDQEWAFGPSNQIPPSYPVPRKPETDLLKPADFNEWKQIDPAFRGLEIIETPGHTPGGVCYWFKDAAICLTGDTLFKGSCGRTDLPGGDARTLTDSLAKLANTLPPETRIISGHGEESTMQHELATNFFLQRFQQ